jgi:hypothetical protein
MYISLHAFNPCAHRLTSYLTDQESSWPGNSTSGSSYPKSHRICTLPGGIPIPSPSTNGTTFGAIGCSSGTPQQNEAAAKAGRDAVLALIRQEREDEERRTEHERQAVLRLWKEKEDEVSTLRDELGRGNKRMRMDDYPVARKGSICLSQGGSPSARSGAPNTPPEDGEIVPTFVGEVALSE